MLLHLLGSPCGLHPSACASDFWTCPQPPPLTHFAQKGCQSTELELRIPTIYLKLREMAQKCFGAPPQNPNPPRRASPPPSADRTHTYTNRKLLTKGFQTCRFFSDKGMPSKSYANGRLLVPYKFLTRVQKWVNSCQQVAVLKCKL